MLKKTHILQVPVDITTENEIIDTIKNSIEQNKKFSIIAININKIMLYQQSEEIAKLIKSFDCFIPDGVSVVKACKKIKARITGVDLFQRICKEHSKFNARIFLYGAKSEVVQQTKTKLEETYPRNSNSRHKKWLYRRKWAINRRN